VSLNIRPQQVLEALNADGQFRHAARRWTIELMLGIGEDRYVLDVLDGHVRRFESTDDLFQGFGARLAGTEDDWRALLQPVPVPFYQDFIGAWFNHGFEISGDLRSVFAHYWALLRLLDVMRSVTAQAEEVS
jgi:hypothetical protein